MTGPAEAELWREREAEVERAAGDVAQLRELRDVNARCAVAYLLGAGTFGKDLQLARKHAALSQRAQEELLRWAHETAAIGRTAP